VSGHLCPSMECALSGHRGFTSPTLTVITVPPFADGAVAELRHGPGGTVIAEIRIPGPVTDASGD